MTPANPLIFCLIAGLADVCLFMLVAIAMKDGPDEQRR